MLTDYTSNKSVRTNRPDYLTVPKQTNVLKCPLNTGLLKNNNLYFDYSRELDLIISSPRASTIKLRTKFVGEMFKAKIDMFKAIGYKHFILYLPIDSVNVMSTMVLDTFEQGIHYGWSTDKIPDVPLSLLVVSNNTNCLRWDCKFTATSSDPKIYGQYKSINEAYNMLNNMHSNKYFNDGWIMHVD
jgi:hypothetical protein